ncbi:MarR family winged helix-turn-helix transcriptional regulator [Actinopolymorpha singaporensis]|uniref:MarR family winged helix-turn-helix transcriptional regulator n=1 Tax=Actinopolymorpha singaporensis TaxID=117157 RepID=UPI001F51D206|nr:MarR family transcriptional regulator [Actinopolymorpha singaporensis]
MTDRPGRRRDSERRDRDRRDLAAMVHPVLRLLVAAELPVLAAHDVSMWSYSVLTALDDGPVRTQATLAEAIGADKTRIIGTLDELQDAGLISRTPDPNDRRARLLSITDEGRRVRRAVRAQIRAKEEHLLARLTPAERTTFVRALEKLSALSPDDLSDDTRPRRTD